jgi:hypothetical protein
MILTRLFRRRVEEPQWLLGDGLFRVEVVGESHYQDALEAICGGRTEAGVRHDCTALLVPEPTNRFDRNATRVDIDGRTVGYLPRFDAIGYRDGLQLARIPWRPLKCQAVIRGGWQRRGDLGQFGVMLDMDWPPRLRPEHPVQRL